MNLRERVIACLKLHHGTPYCAICISRELGVSLDGVYDAIRYFDSPSRAHLNGIVREKGRCGGPCGNIRFVVHVAK
jgi:hypothetical protein